MAGAGAKPFVDAKIQQRPAVLFVKRGVPECTAARTLLDTFNMKPSNYEVVEIESRQDVSQIETYFQTICLTDTRAVPQLFVGAKYAGGEKEINRLHTSGELKKMLGTAKAL